MKFPPAKFEVSATRISSGIKEASDVVALPGGRFLVVGDTSDKVGLIEADGTRRKIELEGMPSGKPSQMEGVAYDPVKHNLLVSREESREIWRYDWNADKRPAPELKRKFSVKHLSGPSNKGIEGLAYLPENVLPRGGARLIGLKEGKPRMIVLFDPAGGKSFATVKVDDSILKLCKDFSAVAVDPKTGHLFLSSDEASLVAEVVLEQKGDSVFAHLADPEPDKASIRLTGVDGKRLQRIEGLATNDRGDLFVLTENDGELLKLVRKN